MKLLRGIVLGPLWLLIWHAEVNYDPSLADYACGPCGGVSHGCYRRAKAMRSWYEGKPKKVAKELDSWR